MTSRTDISTDKPITEKVSDAAQHVADDVRQAATAKADAVKDDVADHVSAVADATVAARAELPSGTPADPLMDQAVLALSRVADHLRHTDLNTLAQEAGSFAKRNPALALGGAALIGFAAARFLKAGPSTDRRALASDPWSNHLERS